MTRTQQRAVESYRRYHPGMGDARPITQAIGSGLLSAAGIVSAVPGGQLPGAVLAAVGAMTGLIGGLFKPDLTKIEASNIVNAIERQSLQPLINSWQSLNPEQKTRSMQDTYLQIFDKAWSAVLQGCGNPALKDAGAACISDRQQGSCKWNGPDGQCWNWFVGYRDPIANDPDVRPDPPAPAEQITDTVSTWFGGGKGTTGAGIPSGLLWIGGALLVWALTSD